jgi:hypothetical protein
VELIAAPQITVAVMAMPILKKMNHTSGSMRVLLMALTLTTMSFPQSYTEAEWQQAVANGAVYQPAAQSSNPSAAKAITFAGELSNARCEVSRWAVWARPVACKRLHFTPQ